MLPYNRLRRHLENSPNSTTQIEIRKVQKCLEKFESNFKNFFKLMHRRAYELLANQTTRDEYD